MSGASSEMARMPPSQRQLHGGDLEEPLSEQSRSAASPSALGPVDADVTYEGIGRRQLVSVLRTHALQKKRAKRQTCCECFSPLFVAMILVAGWAFAASRADSFPPRNFADDPVPAQLLFDSTAAAFGLEEGAIFARPADGSSPDDGDIVCVTPGDALLPPGQELCVNTSATADSATTPEASDDSDADTLATDVLDYNGPLPVPSFDLFVQLHNGLDALLLATSTRDDVERLEQFTEGRLGNLPFLGSLEFAPDTPAVRALVDDWRGRYQTFDQVFGEVHATERDAVDKALQVRGFDDRAWAVLVFDELDPAGGRVDYTIRTNYTTLPRTDRYFRRLNLGLDQAYQKYLLSGFLTLQVSVDSYVLRQFNATGADDGAAPLLDAGEVLEDALGGDAFNLTVTVPDPGEVNVTVDADALAALADVLELATPAELRAAGVNVTDEGELEVASLLDLNVTALGDVPALNGTDLAPLADVYDALDALNATLEVDAGGANATTANLTEAAEAVRGLSDTLGAFNAELDLGQVLVDAGAGEPGERVDLTAAVLEAALNGTGEDSLQAVLDILAAPLTELASFTTVPFPLTAYELNPFYEAAGPLAGLVLTLGLLYPVSSLIKSIVEEKESRVKETMLIMGLSKAVHGGAWLVTGMVVFLLVALMQTLLCSATFLGRTDPTLVFVFFGLFNASAVTFSVMVTKFFNKSKVAGVVGPLSLFICVMPRYIFFADENSEAVGDKTMASLFLSPVAFSFGADLMLEYEGANQGMTWDQLYEDDFSLGAMLTILAFDVVLYLVLGLYFERVLPAEFGQRLPWYFPVLPSYWCPRDEATSSYAGLGATAAAAAARDGDSPASAVEDDVRVERQADGQVPLVRLRGLRKVYANSTKAMGPGKVAVHGTDLNLYKDSICAVLGHNGAGKSTTISMLTGLYSPTAGNAYVGPAGSGLNIVDDMPLLRRSMGICPQHSVLLPRLTAREHLLHVAAVKGVRADRAAAKAEELMRRLDLLEKADSVATTLSGGQKRKLSVAMALLASRIVFLDEPAAGIDAASRRSMWSVLQSVQRGRVIVLTTHDMVEASILGDQIAIMAHGKLQVAGSPLFLKARFSAGYSVSVVRAAASRSAAGVGELLRRHVPAAALEREAGLESTFRVPLEGVASFPPMFRELEARREELGVSAFGVSMTSLEEVFMRLSTLTEPEVTALLERSAAGRGVPLPAYWESAEEQQQQAEAAAATAASAGGVGGGGGGTAAAGAAPSAPQAATTVRGDETSTTGSEGDDDGGSDTAALSALGVKVALGNDELGVIGVKGRGSAFPVHVVELTRKRLIYSTRDLRARFFEIVLPVLVVVGVMAILSIDFNPAGPSLTLDTAVYDSNRPKRTLESAVPEMFAGTAGFEAEEPDTLPRLADGERQRRQDDARPGLTSYELGETLLAEFDAHPGLRLGAFLLNDTISQEVYAENAEGAAVLNGTLVYGPYATVMHNTTMQHGLGVLGAELNRARFEANYRRVTGGDPDATMYRVRNHPLPLTEQGELRIAGFLSLFAALFLLLPFSFLPASAVIMVVKERAQGVKHLHLVSGVSPAAYWVSSFVFDYIFSYLVVVASVMAVFALYANSQFVADSETAQATLAVFVMYGASAIPLAYCFSTAYESHGQAQVAVAGKFFVLGFVLVVASFVLASEESTQSVDELLQPFYRISPAFALGDAMIQLSLFAYFDAATGTSRSAFDWEITGENLTYMAFTSVGYFALLMVIEYRLLARPAAAVKALARRVLPAPAAAVSARGPGGARAPEDSDVEAERARVLSGGDGGAAGGDEETGLASVVPESELTAGGGDAVRVESLTVDYPTTPPLRAVDDLCLGVAKGSVFGLLGENGAGKSTTLKVLTGDLDPTGGAITVGGANVVTQRERARRRLGYCPQYDPLSEKLTAREHLVMYARLRGVPAGSVHPLVDALIERTGLTEYADTVSGSYSGGNKRKLSLAIALVGNPAVIALDEPSSGLDPASRRQMWRIVSKLGAAGGRSVLLISHIMEECEALCGRIGIMVAGRMVCIGSAQHLKSRYGTGYRLHVALRLEGGGEGGEDPVDEERRVTSARARLAERERQVTDFVTGAFPGATLYESHAGHIAYHLPVAGGGVQIADIFEGVEGAKNRLGILDYSVAQSSLEDVFLRMVALGKGEGEGGDGVAGDS